MIKLSDWCKQHGIKYLTGYRWFKDGKMPVNAYQTASGTILVEEVENFDDDSLISEVPMVNDSSDSPVAQLLKKTIEMSKSGAPVEELTTFIISKFKLAEHGSVSEPVSSRRSKMKPTKEMTESHFKQFMKQPNKKPEGSMFLVNENDLENIVAVSEANSSGNAEFSAESQKFGKVVPAYSTTKVNKELLTDIVSSMNTAMQPLPTAHVATPKNNTMVENGVVFIKGTTGGSTIGMTDNFTLSAASGIPTVPTTTNFFSALASSPIQQTSGRVPTYSLESHDLIEFDEEMNEASQYNPVTYDEAKALVSLISDVTDPLTVDRKAKQFCALDRDTFDSLVKSAKRK